MEKVKEMSIADIKASWDFMNIFLLEIKEKLEKENGDVNANPKYMEVLSILHKLYDELHTRIALIDFKIYRK